MPPEPAAELLVLPEKAPCAEAEYLIRTVRGATVRSAALKEAAACADPDCAVRGPARVADGRLVCDEVVCRWIVRDRPSPLQVVGDANWAVTATCPGGTVEWSTEGGMFASWALPAAGPSRRPALPGFAATPTAAGAVQVAEAAITQVRATLAQCDRVGCSPEVLALRARFDTVVARRAATPELGPAVSWAPAESGRPEGWSARFPAGPDTVLEVAAGRVSEGGSGWVVRATTGTDTWLSCGFDADGPTSATVWMGQGWISVTDEDGGRRVRASRGVLRVK